MANQAEINKLLREANAIKRKAQEILSAESKATGALAADIKKTNDEYKDQVALLKDINEKITTQRQTTKEQIETFKSQEQSLKGLTGVQASLVATEREKIKLLADTSSMYPAQRESLESISQLNQELLKTSAEDVVSRADIKKSIDAEIAALDQKSATLGKGSKKALQLMKDQYKIADSISSLTEGEQKALEQQIAAYEGIRDTIGGVLDTAAALTKTTGGIVGSLIIGFGKIAGVVGKTTREMGGFIGGLTGATAQVSLLGTIFPQALDSAKGLSSEFGGLNDLSFQTQLNTNLMATNMGISGAEAAALTGNFARLNGGSIEMGQNLAESTKQLAIANGLMPSQVMADVAGSAKAFAEYGKDGGKNIGIAAVAAGKLGVNMATMTGVTDSLLDFESSITKELELGAMLGKNINLGKARQLAYEGKIGASVKEALKEMGGIESFNKMDIYQKRAAAAALGVSTEELQKMATNMDKLNDDGTMQLSTFESLNQTMKALASGPAATFLQTLGGGVIAIGQMGEGFGTLGKMFPNSAKALGGMWGKMKGIAGSTWDWVKGLFKAKAIEKATEGGGIAKDVGGSIADKGTDLVTDKITDVKVPDAPAVASGPSMGDKLKDLAGGLKEMGNAKVLFGALNLIPTGIGFLFMTAGIPGMMGTGSFGAAAGTGLVSLGLGLTAMGTGAVSLGALNLALAGAGFLLMTPGIIGMAGVALLGVAAGAGLTALGVGLSAFGMTAPGAIIGIGLLALLGLAMIPFGYALSLITPLVESFGNIIIGVLAAVPPIITAIAAGMVSMLGAITLEKALAVSMLGLSFLTLAGSLLALSIASLFALPALMGLAFIVPLLGAGFNLLGTGMQSVGLGLSSIMTSLGGLVGIIGPVTMLSLALLGLSGALMGLGLSMAFLGFAGLPGMLMLAGIAAISAPIIKLAGLFGVGGEGGDSETSSLEEGSLSEYETNMLAKMDQLIQATSSQRDIYLDKDKVTNVVMDRGERSAVNKFSLNKA
jgi:hypothetical protein